jgi:hypothetical protein
MKTEALETKCGASSLQRPRYSAGLLLEDEDLTAAVAYTRETMRLLMRSLFGCGVVCGLDVKASLACNGTKIEITVEKGLALDGAGNPIHVTEAMTFQHDFDCEQVTFPLWVAICYDQKECRSRDVSCSPDDDVRRESTRIRDGFRIELHDKYPSCICACGQAPVIPKKRGGCCSDDDDAADPAKMTHADAAEKMAHAADAMKMAHAAEAAKKAQANVPAEAAVSEDAPAPAQGQGSGAPPPAQARPAQDARPEQVDPSRAYLDMVAELCGCYGLEKSDCTCDCESACVMLAEIGLDPASKAEWKGKSDKQALIVDPSRRRDIRPTPIGLLRCMLLGRRPNSARSIAMEYVRVARG